MSENKQTGVFTKEEQDAMRARAKELKAEAKAAKNREEGEKAVMNAISQMGDVDKSLATKIHQIVKETAPSLWPKTWYGMPAYATTEGKIICFFQSASRFKVRYSSFGFQPDAKIDEGNMWATSFALTKITSAEEARIIELVKKAVQ